MNSYVAIGFSAVMLVAVIRRPAVPTKGRGRRGIPCTPYLGECIPPETPDQREDRENGLRFGNC